VYKVLLPRLKAVWVDRKHIGGRLLAS